MGMAAADAEALEQELACLEAMYPDGRLELGQARAALRLPLSGQIQICAADQPSLTLHFNLPAEYPAQPAELCVGCGQLAREAVDAINEWVVQGEWHEHEMQLLGLASELPAVFDHLGLEQPAAPLPEPSSPAPQPAAPLVEFRMNAEELERCRGHSGLEERQIDRQWLTFVAFSSAKLSKAFKAAADQLQLTGYLAMGRPATACIEGGPKATALFLTEVRTDVFATVDKQSRKMNVAMMEEACTRIRFEGFSVFESSEGLKDFLLGRGIVQKTINSVALSKSVHQF